MNKSDLISILMGPIPGSVLWISPNAPRQFLALKEVQQSPEHHPEGSAHFPLVVDNMALLIDNWNLEEDLTDVEKLTLLLGALCHDLGKAVSTFWHETKKKWVAYGHEVEGVPIAEQLLRDYNLEEYIPKVSKLVRWHMTHINKSFSEKSVSKLIQNLAPATIPELILLMSADCASRPPLDPNLPPAILNELVPIYKKLTSE